MKLPLSDRLKLAAMLLEISESGEDESSAEGTWEKEISDRIRAINEGWEKGVSPEDVMRSLDRTDWDKQFQEDVEAGRFDTLADEAIRDHRDGRSQEL